MTQSKQLTLVAEQVNQLMSKQQYYLNTIKDLQKKIDDYQNRAYQNDIKIEELNNFYRSLAAQVPEGQGEKA